VLLPGLGEMECSGLILLVGPNSSGKTQLLRDIYSRILGEPRDPVVAEEVRPKKPESWDSFMRDLIAKGQLTKAIDESGSEVLRPQTSFVGTGQAASQISVQQARTLYRSWEPQNADDATSLNQFLNCFGRLLVTALFLGNRLTGLPATGAFDFETQPPQNELQALYVDDAAKAALLREVRATFSRSLWLDTYRGNNLWLRVSDDPNTPTNEERLSPTSMAGYRTIDTEGDGLKSYVAIALSLLLGRRPVCLIDEPEMCLHPPQAYQLGRFIGRFGASTDRATFVATHSSHVLRGVIREADSVQIVRLTRTAGAFAAHRVSAEVLADILKRPTVRAETVLDGIFAQAVTVVEADGDRALYQAVSETLAEEAHLEVHFTAVGGASGMPETCRAYGTLRIPAAVIVDLDVLTNGRLLQRIVSAVAGEAEAKALRRAADSIAAALKTLPPTVSPDEVRRGLNEMAALGTDWSRNDDVPLRERLVDLSRRLDRMRELKRGGIDRLPPPIRDDVRSLADKLAKLGVFVVPVGELEEWLGGRGITASKGDKWAWADQAATKVRQLGAQQGDIWDFMRLVHGFLRHELRLPNGG